MLFLPYSKLHAVVVIVTLAKVCVGWNHNNPRINPKPLLRKAENHASQLTVLNLNHFKMVEEMGLKITASRSP
jgi:hypothetical protein